MRISLTIFLAILSALSGGICFADIPVVGVTPVGGATVPKKSRSTVTTSPATISEEILTLRRQLLDANRTADTRYDAARMLLRRDTPEARAALLEALGETASGDSQIAAAKALAHLGGDHNGFLKKILPSLRRLLREKNADVSQAAALALASTDSDKVAEELRTAAEDSTLDVATRSHIIDALSRRDEKKNIETLIE